METLKFRARIKPGTMVYFTLAALAVENKFSIRELLRPWLAEGNIPDQYIGHQDRHGVDIYENDLLRGAHPHKNRKHTGYVVRRGSRFMVEGLHWQHLDDPSDAFSEGMEYWDIVPNAAKELAQPR